MGCAGFSSLPGSVTSTVSSDFLLRIKAFEGRRKSETLARNVTRSCEKLQADCAISTIATSARLVRFGNHHPAVDLLAREDAFAGAIVLVHQRDAARSGFEFLDPRVAGRVVFEVRHDEFTAAFFGGDVAQDRLHFADRIGEDGVVLEAFFCGGVEVLLHLVERCADTIGETRLRDDFLSTGIAPLEYNVTGREIARTEF